jgi:dihydrolipoamide dehydrogenase
MSEKQKDVDVVVIGAGPGGYVAAIRAAQLGRKVHLIDAMERLGGVCLNWGCIPSKALIHVANFFSDIERVSDLGIAIDSKSLDLAQTQTWKNGILKKLSKGIEQLCKDNGITIHRGIAYFTSRDSIMVEKEDRSESLKFKNAIIATGAHAIELPGLPFGEAKGIVSSKGALGWSELPKKLVVVGAGYIGIELGTVFAKFGSEVTIIEALDRILPEIDQELSRPVERKLKKRGVRIILGSKVKGLDGRTVELEGGDKIEADKVLVAVGRKPNTDNLSLDTAGVLLDEKGFIKVAEDGMTTNSLIYAIGDVVGGALLAHKASAEGKIAAEAMCGQAVSFDHFIPSVIFSDPEIAMVGLTEAQASEKGIKTSTGQFPFAALGRAMASHATDGFVKIVADAETKRLIGCQMVGPHVSELIATVTHALEMGAEVDDLLPIINTHPTFSEAIGEAVESIYGRAIHISPRKQKKES